MKNPFIDLNSEDWEYFAEDVLYHLGYEINMRPSLGVDEGKDLIVIKAGVRYLVSCKHYKKAVGVADDIDIRDRLEMHQCQGFIPFYSSSITSGLQKKFIALKKNNYDVIELDRSKILDVIPTMMGFVLSKYFKEPHKIYHHVNENMIYKALSCLKCDCDDIFSKENIPLSMVTLYKKEDKLHFEYGCKRCINKYPPLDFVGHMTPEKVLNNIMPKKFIEICWMEISQIRFFEEFFEMRDFIDLFIQNKHLEPSSDFYKNFYTFHTALMQIMVPQGWGVWLPKTYKENMSTISL